jgi:hypothetical protein
MEQKDNKNRWRNKRGFDFVPSSGIRDMENVPPHFISKHFKCAKKNSRGMEFTHKEL